MIDITLTDFIYLYSTMKTKEMDKSIQKVIAKAQKISSELQGISAEVNIHTPLWSNQQMVISIKSIQEGSLIGFHTNN